MFPSTISARCGIVGMCGMHNALIPHDFELTWLYLPCWCDYYFISLPQNLLFDPHLSATLTVQSSFWLCVLAPESPRRFSLQRGLCIIVSSSWSEFPLISWIGICGSVGLVSVIRVPLIFTYSCPRKDNFSIYLKRKLQWLPLSLKLLSSSSTKTKVSLNNAFPYVLWLSRAWEHIIKIPAEQKFILNGNIYRNCKEGCSVKHHRSCQKYISAGIVWWPQTQGKLLGDKQCTPLQSQAAGQMVTQELLPVAKGKNQNSQEFEMIDVLEFITKLNVSIAVLFQNHAWALSPLQVQDAACCNTLYWFLYAQQDLWRMSAQGGVSNEPDGPTAQIVLPQL